MSEERKQILQMLADGKIKVDEAERLLEAVSDEKNVEDDDEEEPCGHKTGDPKYLRVIVEPKSGHREGHGRHKNVNVKIPIMLIKAGVQLGAVMPDHARERLSEKFREKGLNIDLKKLDGDTLDKILKALQTMSIDVDDDDERVRVCCE